MKKTMLFTVLGAFVMMWMGWGMYIIYTTERPAYTVTQLLAPDVEVRQYEEQTWISTTYDSDDNSFPVLASYIFGRNQEQETVAMTAPVITDEKMSFILPAGYPPTLHQHLTDRPSPLPLCRHARLPRYPSPGTHRSKEWRRKLRH